MRVFVPGTIRRQAERSVSVHPMTDADVGAFDRAFGRVCGAFRVKLSQAEREEVTRTYFKVLEPYPFDDVVAAGRRCLETLKKFPTIADWIAELDARQLRRRATDHPALRQMTPAEIEDLSAAERARYTDGPCCCADCRAVGIEGQPLRYVPTIVNNTEDRAWHPQRQRLEVLGHWAHGWELARWYAARAEFVLAAQQHRIARSLALVGVREPGEEG